MYVDHFGLNEKPFSIAPDPRYLYMSESHQEALAHLLYGLQTEGGFVLLTGEIGTGKTTLCKSMFEQAPPEINFAFIINPKVTDLELLETVCDELSIEKPETASKKNLIDIINKHLLQVNEQGKKTVIVIDEAQNLLPDVLEQLRLLTNLETSRHKLLQIILLGQPELRELIRKPELSQLSQRITARYHLGPLSREETTLYIMHRIGVAGGHNSIFTNGAIKLVYKLTGGVPRLINLLCDRALLGTYTELEDQVSRGIVKQASQETFDSPLPRRTSWWLLAALVSVAIFVLGSVFVSRDLGVYPLVPPVAIEQVLEAPPAPVVEAVSVPPVTINKTIELDVAPALWPENLGFGNRFNSVFRDLAALWQHDYLNEELDPCLFASSKELGCLTRNGSFEDIQSLNRPAILTLYDDKGLPFYALLAGLNSHRALFIVAGQELELDVKVLENRWFGEYFLLWKTPAGFSGLLYPGQQSTLIGWLAAALERQGLYQTSGTEKKLEGGLLGALKRFQFGANLVPDGVLGAQTIIQLNRSLEAAGPQLIVAGAN